ncbi:MAG: hypothetical protein A2854_04195 [Parcubacteria group bacterium RIFCSPHIGHO2_01_FULL_56_18]|nr:MAG: hypothetical protein A2854_04195 [Parcubacteria group bacterium RIFCSPHIGHO2_01_FULL_56_18]
MTFKGLVKKEIYVALHAQTARFRVVKYIVIFAILFALYVWKGWGTTWKTLLAMFVFGTAVHFFFRWKTKGWTESWWSYQSLFERN